jgi:hypothetical protein
MTRLMLVAGLFLGFAAGLVSLPQTDLLAGGGGVTIAAR